jgi:phosphatidylglycerophosphatase A
MLTTSMNFQTLTKFFVSGCGAGFLPKAPGTWGSLLALPLFWWLQPVYLPFVLLGLFFLSWPLIAHYSQTNKTSDPQEIVIDEIIGQGLCFLFVPHTILWWGISFMLFRFFDISKPFPVSWADQLKGPLLVKSLAILLDDIIAGLMAGGMLYVILSIG